MDLVRCQGLRTVGKDFVVEAKMKLPGQDGPKQLSQVFEYTFVALRNLLLVSY